MPTLLVIATGRERGNPVEHVVFFTGADGASLFRRTADLDEAVRFVEHLRNEEGVDSARVFALAEVPLAFKPYYRVEVPGSSQPTPHVTPSRLVESVPTATLPEPVAPPAMPEPVMPPAPLAAMPFPEIPEIPDVPEVREPVFDTVLEPAPPPVFDPSEVAEPVPDETPARFEAVPGADVLPNEELVGAEATSRNGRARGIGFFSR